MRTWHAFLLVCAVALAGTAGTLLFQAPDIYRVERFPMDAEVKQDFVIGVNADPGGFHFGSLRPGGGSARTLSIDSVETELRVRLLPEGEMASWVSVPPPFVLREGGSRNVTITIGIPRGTASGNYTGTLAVFLEKA